MSTTAVTQSETSLVLDSIVGNMRASLTDAAIESIRPDIAARVERLLQEMKPQIESYRDVQHDKIIVQFSVREPQP